MRDISFVKYVLVSPDGTGICTPKVQGWQFLTVTFPISLDKRLGFSYASPKLVSIWLSLSTTKVHKLKPGSPYLSKTLRAVKSLNNVMTHLFLPGLEMWDPLVMPPGSSPCCHPGVLGAQHRPAHGWAETAKSLPSTGDSHLGRERKSQSRIPWKYQGYSSKQHFSPVTVEL